MNHIMQPNLLLEALAYWGRRVSGNTWDYMERRIDRRGVTPSEDFTQGLQQLRALTAALDECLPPESAGQAVFTNLEGFAHTTIGSASPAFLLYYASVASFDGDFSALMEQLLSLSPQQWTVRLAIALSTGDAPPVGDTITKEMFLDQVLALPVADASKLAVLQLWREPRETLLQASALLEPTIAALQENSAMLEALTDTFAAQVEAVGREDFLARQTSLSIELVQKCQLRPFLFGMDTNLTADSINGPEALYCGILRQQLLTMTGDSSALQEEVYEAFRLLGDRTRFDILCYLRGRSAYGQELCAKFGLSRNTIHHHMNKLVGSGLVKCTVDGSRVYYTLDQRGFSALLRHQRAIFGENQSEKHPG